MSTSETNPTPAGTPSNPADLPSQVVTDPVAAGGEAPLDDYEELTPELVEDEAIRGDFVIRWAVILLAFLLASTKVGEAITLVQIKSGQYLASHGVLPPRTDVFSSTATDRPWINLSWAFDLVLGTVYSATESIGLSGFVGVSLFKALLAAIAFGFVAHISRRGLPTWWSSICAALALLACHLRFAAHPTLITFLGLAILFWTLHRYREKVVDPSATSLPRLWLLLPLFLLWANFDSRAFLGVAALLLYAAGETVGSMFGAGTSLPAAARRQLWVVGLGCAAVLLLHPWHIHSLLAPRLVYGVEYTAIREFASMAYLGEPRPVFSAEAWYFPLWYGALWEQFDYAAAGAVIVILAAVTLFLFNARRLVWGELFAFLGMLGFATLCLRELPAAAVVAAIVAGLNGQSWYQANCSQTYTTNGWELFFSRAGRAVTVLVLAALAFFGGTGRLREPSAPQSGYGLDNNLASLIGDLQARLVGLPSAAAPVSAEPSPDLQPGAPPSVKEPVPENAARSFDDRPFNFAISHGDVLIWIGQKPFIDSRLVVYYDPDEERNLLATNQKVRQALREPKSAAASSPTGRGSLKGTDSALAASQARERREYWKKVLNDYQITHLLLRLSISSTLAQREYEVFTDLLSSPSNDWQLTDLGASCAVLYRTDLDNPELKKFLADRTVDFKEMAYKRSAPLLSARDRWVRNPSFYQRYLWSQRREISPSIQQAMQYAQMATLPGRTETVTSLALPQNYAESRAALALLAVRKAQEGLQDDPDSYWGYLVLGEAYSVLAKWEAALAQNPSRTQYSGLRYFQAMASYNQALVASPDDVLVHQQLAALYAQANRIDLELRHQEALYALISPIPDIDAEQLLSLETRIRDLNKKVQAVQEKDEQAEQQGRAPFERAIELAQQGFVLKAIQVLDRQAEARTGNLAAEQLRVILQIEAGRAEEAYENAERFAVPAQEARMANWQDPVAFANLPNADYPRAQSLWVAKCEEASRGSFSGLLENMAPRPRGLAGWPLSTTSSAANWFFQRPEAVCESRLNLALIHLEEGNLVSAQRELELALAAHPESANRNLILHYLVELRGSDADVEPFPPSQSVPGLFASEEEFANRAPIVDELAD